MFHKHYDRKDSVEKIFGCGSQRAWQEELIVGKLPDVM
jgi:hypothetical protein